MADGRFGPAAVALAGVMARALGWRPDEFWAATPADVATVLATEGEAGAGMDGRALATMMERFPDE